MPIAISNNIAGGATNQKIKASSKGNPFIKKYVLTLDEASVLKTHTSGSLCLCGRTSFHVRLFHCSFHVKSLNWLSDLLLTDLNLPI